MLAKARGEDTVLCDVLYPRCHGGYHGGYRGCLSGRVNGGGVPSLCFFVVSTPKLLYHGHSHCRVSSQVGGVVFQIFSDFVLSFCSNETPNKGHPETQFTCSWSV